ncbi:MAG TPA: SGNH/GDSL hydrolase family protein, partial [Acidimicrobiales bacterium]
GFTEWTHVGDPAFDELAYDEYRAATELLTSRGARMLWMLAAHQDRPLAPMTDPARIDRLNEIVADVAATVPNTSLVDYPSWLADVSSRLDRQLRRDGLHLSDDGIAEVVPWLADDVLGSVVPVRTSS